MKLKIILSILILSLPLISFAEKENNPIEFTEVYSQLGFVDEINLQERVQNLKENLVNKSIKWELTLQSVYKSGRPNFVEAFKIVDDTTKYSVAKFHINEEYQSQWKELKWGEEIEFTGKITNIVYLNMQDSKGDLIPFIYMEVSDCIPLVVSSSSL